MWNITDGTKTYDLIKGVTPLDITLLSDNLLAVSYIISNGLETDIWNLNTGQLKLILSQNKDQNILLVSLGRQLLAATSDSFFFAYGTIALAN